MWRWQKPEEEGSGRGIIGVAMVAAPAARRAAAAPINV